MKNWICESPRLFCRYFTKDDIDNLFLLDSNPAVMRFINRPALSDLDEAKIKLEKIIAYNSINPGLGIFATIEKETNNFIGWHALKHLDNTEEIELGYRLVEEFWGKGYATEMGKKLVQYAFEQIKLNQIVGITHFDNIASQKVLLKCGLRYIKDAFYYGADVRYFAIDKE